MSKRQRLLFVVAAIAIGAIAAAVYSRENPPAPKGVGREAAVFAADALRRARLEANGGYTLEAEKVLTRALERGPDDYDALRMLGAVYMSQHRFREAIEVGTRAMHAHPKDAWNYGVVGDAHIELGEYDAAFDAFDTMARLRPDAGAD